MNLSQKLLPKPGEGNKAPTCPPSHFKIGFELRSFRNFRDFPKEDNSKVVVQQLRAAR